MSELRIVKGSIRSLLEENSDNRTVSSSFEYVPGSLNSPYIITSSAVGDPERTIRSSPSRGQK